MAARVVGITSTSTVDAGKPPQHILNRAYVTAVDRAGGLPLVLPSSEVEGAAERCLGIIDGLLLSGGADVNPALYGEPAHKELGRVDELRDGFEMPLIRAAVSQGLPIFAICRGIQALNVALGGALFQDLPAQRPSKIAHSQDLPRCQFSHTVQPVRGTRLASIAGGPEMQVNSFHHQALRDVADGLQPTAYAPDGVIEAVEGTGSSYLVAVQFHPEETAPHDEASRRLFEVFVRAL